MLLAVRTHDVPNLSTSHREVEIKNHTRYYNIITKEVSNYLLTTLLGALVLNALAS